MWNNNRDEKKNNCLKWSCDLSLARHVLCTTPSVSGDYHGRHRYWRLLGHPYQSVLCNPSIPITGVCASFNMVVGKVHLMDYSYLLRLHPDHICCCDKKWQTSLREIHETDKSAHSLISDIKKSCFLKWWIFVQDAN